MKSFFSIFLITTTMITCRANSLDEKRGDSIVVYIFLHESCKISQYYTLTLNELHAKYNSKELEFVGLFPNISSKAENIQAFKEKYHVSFELKADYKKVKTEQLGAKITPEVVVYDEKEGRTLYKGRIDNSYARLGRRRGITTTSELKDVLEAIHNCSPITINNTDAIGCFINMKKPSAP